MFNIAVLNSEKNQCIQIKQVGDDYTQTEFDVVVDSFDLNLKGMDYSVGDGFTVPAVVAPTLIPIVFSGTVTGALTGFDDGPNQFTVNENTDLTATGTLAIPKSTFRVPFKRIDTGRIQLMVATVIDGSFTLSMNFKTGGEWVVNEDLVNLNMPTPTFSITEQKFSVI
jgi:hypothetical protein